MPGLTERVFLYLLRAAGMFLLHVSGMLEVQMTDELKSYLSMFKDALDYARYLPLFYFGAMVGNYYYQNITS